LGADLYFSQKYRERSAKVLDTIKMMGITEIEGGGGED
jgi:hypothetical protein